MLAPLWVPTGRPLPGSLQGTGRRRLAALAGCGGERSRRSPWPPPLWPPQTGGSPSIAFRFQWISKDFIGFYRIFNDFQGLYFDWILILILVRFWFDLDLICIWIWFCFWCWFCWFWFDFDLDLVWFWFDLDLDLVSFWFDFDWILLILIRFGLDFGWIRFDFGWIRVLGALTAL